MFLVRVAFTSLFTAYALSLNSNASDDDDGASSCAHRPTATQFGLMVALAVMTAEYLIMELRQLAQSGFTWFSHMNAFDAAQLGLMSAILALHWACYASLDTLRGLSSVLVLVLFWRLLYFATVTDRLGSFVRMVLKVRPQHACHACHAEGAGRLCRSIPLSPTNSMHTVCGPQALPLQQVV